MAGAVHWALIPRPTDSWSLVPYPKQMRQENIEEHGSFKKFNEGKLLVGPVHGWPQYGQQRTFRLGRWSLVFALSASMGSMLILL